jgi:hypothetical protein
LNALVRAATRELKAATGYDHTRPVVGVNVHPVRPGSLGREGAVRRINLNGIAGRQIEDAHANTALPNAKLHQLIIEVRHGEVGSIRHADRERANLYFGSRALIGVKTIPRGDCVV